MFDEGQIEEILERLLMLLEPDDELDDLYIILALLYKIVVIVSLYEIVENTDEIAAFEIY